MNKLIFAIILIGSCLASAIAGAVFTGKLMSNIIEENKEEELLTRLAYSQLLIQDLDSQSYDSLRETLLSDMNASIFHTHQEIAYEFKYRDACLIHKSIYEYRNELPESQIPKGELEEGVQKILEMWGKKDCEI